MPLFHRSKKLIAQGESADVFLLEGRKKPRVIRRRTRFIGDPVKKGRHRESRIRYFDMQLARLLFPENAIRATRVSARKGKFTEIHSDYYPQPKGIASEAERIRKRIMEAHRGTANPSEVGKEVDAFDRKIRKEYPEVIKTAEKMKESGFEVAHPEVNFTVRNGKIVFYEIDLAGSLLINERRSSVMKIMDRITEKTYLLAGQGRKQEARKLGLSAIKLVTLREISSRTAMDATLNQYINANFLYRIDLISREEFIRIMNDQEKLERNQLSFEEVNRMLNGWGKG